MKSISPLASLVITIGSYIFLLCTFYSALVNPSDHLDFVYQTGFFLLLIEFMNIHSTGMLNNPELETGIHLGSPIKFVTLKYAIFAFYLIFVFAFLAFFKNKILTVYFLISLVTKLFAKSEDHWKEIYIFNLFLFLGSVVLISFSAPVYSYLFPFSPEIYSQRPANISGVFVDYPQSLLVWGIIYNALGIFKEIYIHFRFPQRQI